MLISSERKVIPGLFMPLLAVSTGGQCLTDHMTPFETRMTSIDILRDEKVCCREKFSCETRISDAELLVRQVTSRRYILS